MTNDDIADALTALTDGGFTRDLAIEAIEVLSGAGFMVIRPQSMLDRLADAVIEARQ